MLKGAIIGFGKIARTNHLPAFSNDKLSQLMKITSVVETNPINLRRSKEEYPELRFYDSLDKLFANEKIDFVDITATPTAHYELLKFCINRNVHIICEKPFTISLQHAEVIKEQLLRSDKIFIPCHQYKYSPIWKEFKKFCESSSGKSGVLIQFNVFRTEADPGLQLLSEKWRQKTNDLGGGILADTGVHYLYLAAWMLKEVKSITTRLLNLGRVVFESEDTALITLESENGIAQISLTWAADKRYNSANITSSSSSVYYTGGCELVVNTNSGANKILVPDMSDKSNYTLLYVSLFSEFVEAILSGKKNDEWIIEAYNSVQLMHQCYKSSKENKSVGLGNDK